jgi:hypothetical protein
MHSVYKCDDFEIEDNIIVIYNAKEIGKVYTVEEFNTIIDWVNYNAIICPGLFRINSKEVGTKPMGILFKDDI